MLDLVSVIIPAYNVEKYINQCVNSVSSQTYENLEIIIVNDGSSDDTEKICESLLVKDNRITVINQENMGLAVARNVGYSHSHGDWICYIDSDDWIEDSFVEVLLNLAKNYDADIVACKSRNVSERGEQTKFDDDTLKVYEYREREIINSLYGLRQNIRFEVWNKLWSRTLINEISFIEGQVSEDVHFDRMAFMKAAKIVYTDTTLHNYRVQRPGNTNSTFKTARLCVFNEFDLWIQELKDRAWMHEANQVGAISCNMAVNMYYEAKRTKQKKEIVEKLLFEFNKFYPYAREVESNRIKLRLFRMNPTAYYIISRIRNK